MPTPNYAEWYLKDSALGNQQWVRCAAAGLGWGHGDGEAEGLGDGLNRLAKFRSSCINAGPHCILTARIKLFILFLLKESSKYFCTFQLQQEQYNLCNKVNEFGIAAAYGHLFYFTSLF